MDLLDLGAGELARRLAGGETSVTKHIRRVLERIAERDSALNAFSQVDPAAVAHAEALDRMPPAERRGLPLFGVPVAIKEEMDVAGLVTTFGGRGNSTPAGADSEVVARLRAAGAVIAGKTNMPEFGQTAYTEGEWGTTRNPHDLDRSPGGSSGGSAVAVAAGMVPLALGGDAGGSIRIPAAWTGIVGLKPSRGRVTTAPQPNLWHQLGTYGPLARGVDDVRLAMRVIAPAEPVTSPTLRVGWTLGSCLPGITPEAEGAAAVERAAGKLAAQGHAVSHGSIRWVGTPLTFLVQFHLGVLDEVRRLEHPGRIEHRSKRVARIGRLLPPVALRWAKRGTSRIEAAMRCVFANFDVLLTPVTPMLPTPITPVHRLGYLASQHTPTAAIAYTSYWNLAGFPAVSVPMGLNADGLPLAVQVIGAMGGDDMVLDVAERLMR